MKIEKKRNSKFTNIELKKLKESHNMSAVYLNKVLYVLHQNLYVYVNFHTVSMVK